MNRCVNCGWTNPDGVQRCQKCNQELPHSIPAPSVSQHSSPAPAAQQRATVRDASAFFLQSTLDKEDLKMTRPNAVSFETAEPKAAEGTEVTEQFKLVKSEAAIPDILFERDGKWYVKGDVDSTAFVQATRDIEVEKGDVILVGNVKFTII